MGRRWILAGLLWLVSSAASAAPFVSVTLLEARFQDPIGGNVLGLLPTTPGFGQLPAIGWGDPVAPGAPDSNADGIPDGLSGYSFAVTPTPFMANGGVLSLGTLTHFNFPIPPATGITQVDLLVRGNITLGDGEGVTEDLVGRELLVRLTHNETDNSNSPACCDDIVGIQVLSSTFGVSEREVGEVVFNAGTLGFFDDVTNQTPVDQFISPEESGNSAIVAFEFTTRPTVVSPFPPPTPIPAPPVGLLIGVALAAVAARRRSGQGRRF